MAPRCTGTNNSTEHFNPKLACHGLYELHTDNKAVVFSGLRRRPSLMWRNNNRAPSLCRWSLRWPWTRCWESRPSRSQTTRFPSQRCVFTPSQASRCRCSPARETATPWWPRQPASRRSLLPNRYDTQQDTRHNTTQDKTQHKTQYTRHNTTQDTTRHDTRHETQHTRHTTQDTTQHNTTQDKTSKYLITFYGPNN